MNSIDVPMMRKAGGLLAGVLATLREHAKVGVTPLQLDTLAEWEIRRTHSVPAFKGYQGFPATLCISVNDQVVHGIPGDRPFADGDVVSIDAGLSFGGYFADAAFTVVLGENPDPEVVAFARAAEAAFHTGLQAIRPGARVGDVGASVQEAAEALGYGVLREYTGHGIGRAMHEEPSIPNFGKRGRGSLLRPGMTIAVEPMITRGSHEVRTLADGWTVVTRDGSLGAHHEHTVLVTDNGAEVLTAQ